MLRHCRMSPPGRSQVDDASAGPKRGTPARHYLRTTTTFKTHFPKHLATKAQLKAYEAEFPNEPLPPDTIYIAELPFRILKLRALTDLQRYYTFMGDNACADVMRDRCSDHQWKPLSPRSGKGGSPPLYLTLGDPLELGYGFQVCEFTTKKITPLLLLDYKTIYAMLYIWVYFKDVAIAHKFPPVRRLLVTFFAIPKDIPLRKAIRSIVDQYEYGRDLQLDTPRSATQASAPYANSWFKHRFGDPLYDAITFNDFRAFADAIGVHGLLSPIKVTQGIIPHTAVPQHGGIIHEEVVMFNCSNLELRRDVALGGEIRPKRRSKKKAE